MSDTWRTFAAGHWVALLQWAGQAVPVRRGMTRRADKLKRPGGVRLCALACAVCLLAVPAFAGITFVAASSAANNGGSPVSVNKPAGVAENDVMVAYAADADTAGLSAPTGWTLIFSQRPGDVGGEVYAWYKVATASEPASYSFSSSGGLSMAAAIVAYRGVNTTSPINVSASTFGTELDPNPPAVSVTEDGSRILTVGFALIDTTSTPPTGYTERFDFQNTGDGFTLTGAERTTDASSGENVNPAAFNFVDEEAWIAGTIALEQIPVGVMEVMSVADGDTSPTAAKLTDFGGVDPVGYAVTNTLTVTNSGSAVLYLTGSPVVGITGHTGDFTADTAGTVTNIAVGASTQFKLIFDPTTTGTRTGVVSIANSDLGKNPYDFYIQGTGLVCNIQLLTVADGDTSPTVEKLTDFGSVYETGYAVTNTLTITNTGPAVLYLTGSPPVAITGHTGDFTVDTAGMVTNVASGASTTFKLIFDPTTTGTRTGEVSIANNDSGKNPYNFYIQGEGIPLAPEMAILTVADGDTTPTALKLTGFGGYDPYYGAGTNTLTITNTGPAVLYLTGSPPVAITGHTGDFTVDTAGMVTNVASGASTTFKLIFDPTTTGTRTGEVSIANNDSDKNPYNFYIQGTGTEADMEVLSVADGDTSPSVAKLTDFGSVYETGFAATNTLTIRNNGPARLFLTGSPLVNITGDTGDFFADTTGMVTNLASGETTTFKLIFDPTVLGTRTGVVAIANNDSDKNPYDFYIKGEGIPPASEMNVTTVAHGDTSPSIAKLTDLGEVFTDGYTSTNTLTIENTGPGTLYLTGGAGTEVAVTGSDFSVDTTGIVTNLAYGESTTFKIIFDPSAEGTRSGSISIPNNDSGKNPYTFDIKGTGVLISPEIQVTTVSNGDTTPSLIKRTYFGVVNTTGYAVTNTLTITNSGNYVLYLTGTPVISITGDTGDFTAVTTSTATNIASGGWTTFDLVFDPTAAGTRTGVVSIASTDAGKNPYTFWISGDGTLDEPNGGIPFSETFETSPLEMAGTLGDVDGQHGWKVSKSDSAIVQAAVFYEGAQAMSVSNAAVSNMFYDVSATNVIWEFWSIPPRSIGVPIVPSGATCVFYINSSSNVVAYSGATAFTLSGVSVTNDIWTKFTVEAEYGNYRWSLSVNDQKVLTNASFYSSGSGYVRGMMYYNDITGTCAYVDSVQLRLASVLPSPYEDADGDGVSDYHEWLAGTDMNDASSYLRIESGDLTNSSDVVLEIFLGSDRAFQLLSSSVYGGAKGVLMELTNSGSAGFNDVIDTNAVTSAEQRFYSIATACRSWTNATEWAMYRQERTANERYLVSAPVKYSSTNKNNLNSKLGEQLARGLYASSDTNAADCIRILNGTWSTYYLATNASGDTFWWDPDSGTTADVQIVNGTGMWVERGSGAPGITNGAFVGMPRSESDVRDISFTADAWQIFSWALPAPKKHVNAGAATATNQLGLSGIAIGGTSSDENYPGKLGDQIWVWEANTWKDKYWLVNNYDPSGDAWNNRWWDTKTGDFADFQLEAGKAYYYRHVTNMYGGTNFTWTPEY